MVRRPAAVVGAGNPGAAGLTDQSMFDWFVLALVVLIALVIVTALGRRRPRTADQLLAQPAGAADATPGIPADAPRSVREAVGQLVAKRATGLLTIQKGAQACSVSILFGHIFDAQCDAVQGEAALLPALDWSDACWSFDPKARLTTNESITTPTRSLLEGPAPDPPSPPA